MTVDDRRAFNIRRLRTSIWKYRPRHHIGPPDPVMLAQMQADGLLD